MYTLSSPKTKKKGIKKPDQRCQSGINFDGQLNYCPNTFRQLSKELPKII